MNTTQPELPTTKKSITGIMLTVLGVVIALIVVAIIFMLASAGENTGDSGLALLVVTLMGAIAVVVLAAIMLAILPFYLKARKKNVAPVQKRKLSLPLVVGVVLLAWVVFIAVYVLVQWYS